jgi:hypothetical protein
MKRYKLVDPSPEYQSCVEKSPTGEWVKHEPWMDEAEKLMGIREMGEEFINKKYGVKTKEPTICVKCKHIIESEFELKPWMVFASPAILKDAIERTSPKCKCGKLNFINGLTEEINCSDKNHGNCLDFELKE